MLLDWYGYVASLPFTFQTDQAQTDTAMDNFISSMQCNSSSATTDREECILGLDEDMLSDWYTHENQGKFFKKPCVDGTIIRDTPHRMYKNHWKSKSVDIVLGKSFLKSHQ